MLGWRAHYTCNGGWWRRYLHTVHGPVVAVTKGRLDFGPWEQIFYGEFDGRRPKRVLIKVIGD